MLNTRCSIQAAADNKLRCLPDSGGIQIASRFADAGCSQPLAMQTVCWGIEMPTYFTRAEQGGSCGDSLRHNYRSRVFKLGAEHTGSLYSGTPQACVASPKASYEAGYRFFPIGAEIPSSSFVEFAAASPATL